MKQIQKYLHFSRPLLAAFIFCASGPEFITHTGIPFLALVASVLFWSLWNQEKYSSQTKWKLTLIYNIGLALFSFYWIPETLEAFGPMPLWLGWILFLLFAPFLYLQNLFLAFIIHQIQRRPKLAVLNQPVALATIAVFCEWIDIRQFPVNISSTWIQWGYSLPMASLFGESIYSYLLYLIVFAFTTQMRTKTWIAIRWGAIIILILDFSISKLIPYQKQLTDSSAKESSLKLRIVQANIGNFIKVSAESGEENSVESVHREYRELSFKKYEIDNGKIDLIIWPETAIPDDFNTEMLRSFPSFMPGRMLDFFQSTPHKSAEVVIGGYDRGYLSQSTNGIESEYNSVIFFSHDGSLKDVYHKRVLIPFGEGLPVSHDIGQKVAEIIPGLSFFSEGHRFSIFETKHGHKFISPICYEILFSSYIRDYLNADPKREVDFILNLTNDSWYGKTAEPWQHLMLAKWKALEFRRPIIRSTNTGITSVIDIDGSESKQLLSGEKAVLDVALVIPKAQVPTLFQLTGKWALSLLMILVLLLYYRKKFTNK